MVNLLLKKSSENKLKICKSRCGRFTLTPRLRPLLKGLPQDALRHAQIGISAIGFRKHTDKLKFVEERPGIEQHCHSEPVRTTFVGISIEFRATYRHTGRSFFVLFPGICLCVIEKWYSYPGDCHTRKADWFAMTGNSTNSNFTISL